MLFLVRCGYGNGSSAWPRYMIQVFKNEYEFAIETGMGENGKGIPGRTEHADVKRYERIIACSWFSMIRV